MKKYMISVLFLSLFFTGCGEKKDAPVTKQTIDVAALLKQDPSIEPVVVIGGGIAGLTAANYLLQANVPCLVLGGPKPGGALAQSDSVRNWPGIFDAPGVAITDSLKDQAERNGAQIEAKSLISIDTKQQPFVLTVQDESGRQETIKTLSCIIAMGTTPNYLGIPGEQEYWGYGVSNCAVCDGALFKNEIVAVVGGGDSAMVEASYLASIAKHVFVLVRGDGPRASDKRKVKQVKALPNVTFMYNTVVSAIRGDGKVITHLELADTKSETAKQNLDIDGLFLAIGSTPNTKIFTDQIKCDATGYLSLVKGQETSIEGIFAAGDICDPFVKQAVTASSMGCQAALQAKEYLDKIGYSAAAAGLSQAIVERSLVDVEKLRSEKMPASAQALVLTIDSLEAAKTLIKECRNRLLVVDIYDKYCIPCQKMAPIFASCAQDYVSKVTFAKLNVSDKSIDVGQFTRLVGSSEEITQVPTFLFIRKGKVVLRKSESMTKEALAALIESTKAK